MFSCRACFRARSLIAALAIALLSPACFGGDTFFVRTAGNDGWSGTSAAEALRTISAAESKAGPGDTVYVGAGIYDEQLDGTASGSSGAAIRYIADTLGAHTSDAGEVRVRQASPSVVELSGVNHVVYEGFVFESTGTSNAVIDVQNAGDIALVKCRMTGGSDGVYILNSSVTLTEVRITSTADGIDIRGSSSDVGIERTRIEDVRHAIYN
ncbi:MAG: hypothetical protein AAF235_05825 [Planctomycetota bacterium]